MARSSKIDFYIQLKIKNSQSSILIPEKRIILGAFNSNLLVSDFLSEFLTIFYMITYNFFFLSMHYLSKIHISIIDVKMKLSVITKNMQPILLSSLLQNRFFDFRSLQRPSASVGANFNKIKIRLDLSRQQLDKRWVLLLRLCSTQFF